MGNTSGDCAKGKGTWASDGGIIAKQIKIYSWRAENSAYSIPLVSLKNPSLLREQQKWAQFIAKYKDHQYLELGKFKRQLENLQTSEEQIIAFQKYACSLADLSSLLDASETAYTLLTLLTAFSRIKTVFTCGLPVDSHCCLVTLKGELRGWINSNPKSNQLQQNPKYKYFETSQEKEMIRQICNIVEQLSQNEQTVNQLFTNVNSFIDSTACRRDLFEETKQFVQRYCQAARIQYHCNLCSALRRTKGIPILKFARKALLNKQNTADCKESNGYYSSRMRSTMSEQSKGHRLCFSRELDNAKGSVPESTLASYVGLNQSTVHKQCSFGVPIKFSRNGQLSRRFSDYEAPNSARTEEHKRSSIGAQVLPSTPKPRIAQDIDWKARNKKEVSINENIFESESSHLESVLDKKDEEGTLLQGKFLTSKEFTTFNLPKVRREHKYRTSNLQNKVLRQISILDIEGQGSAKENDNRRVHFHTSQDVKSSETSIEPPARPWITTKTISQLISQHDEADSLVHSMGTSSEDCAPSSYSGALSGMGREVLMTKKTKYCQAEAQ